MRRAFVLAAFLSALSIVFVAATAFGTATALVSADTGRTPLVVLGMMTLAIGIALLRRPVVVRSQ